jgi:signal transduction histidine kinase
MDETPANPSINCAAAQAPMVRRSQRGAESSRLIPSHRFFWYAATFAVIVVSLLLDIVLPRGATAAIGYAIVPVLAAVHRKAGFILAMTALCTLLTWLGYFVEPAGIGWWFSLFDRAMVSMVLWLSFLLATRALGLSSALADRTRSLEQAMAELARSNDELDRFASVVAHDLRGPLNAVGMATQVMLQYGQAKDDPETADCLRSIQREMQWMSQLVQRLLTYGRVGGGALRISECDCNAALSAAKASLSALLTQSQAVVTRDPLPVIQADPVLIEELFQNLIENAIKYRRSCPPAIHVSAERDGDRWVIAVRDNGVGIEPENADRIFSAFTQTNRRKEGGVGLGLATCKRIVERHGGSISATSVLNEGSTFWIRLPAGADSATTRAASEPAPVAI